MVKATRWQAMKRAMAREARAIMMTIQMVGDKEGNGMGSKSDGNDNEGAGQQRGQW